MAIKDLTSVRLKELLSYDPLTGVFVWKVSRQGHAKAGDIAGKRTERGHTVLHVDQKKILLHRAAWLYMTGDHPGDGLEIDHINGDPSDNRWANLRCVDRATNCQNIRKAKARKNGGTLLGAHWCIVWKRWKSSITINYKKYHIGWFDTEQQAHEAYVRAKRKFHEGCTI